MKADDDTWIHFENLLAMLSEYNYLDPVYVGRAGEFGGAGGTTHIRYCGGGAGYLVSQEAMRRWYPHIDKCERLRYGYPLYLCTIYTLS